MVPTRDGIKKNAILAIRKCETDWICHSLTAPVNSRTISRIILITLAGKDTGSSAATPSPTKLIPKIRASSPITLTFIDPLPFLSNRPVPLTPRSLWRNSLPALPGNGPVHSRGPVFSLLGGTEFRLRQGFASGKTLVRRLRAAPSAMGPPPKRRGTACSDCPGPSYSQIAVAK